MDGRLVAPEGPDDGAAASLVWVFAAGRALERPRAAPAVDAAARSLAGGPERSLDLGEQTRFYALPVVENGVRYGTLVSAISLDPYEETGGTALIGSLLLAAALLAAVTLVSQWMLRRALRPVSLMTENAEAWSENDLGRRFDLGEPYDELTRLGTTLDGLLERIAASLRHEQRFTAELSHELRTPLARMRGETELMLSRPRSTDEYREALEAIQRNVDQMTRTVEALVAASRHEAGLDRTTSDARDAVVAVAQHLRESAVDIDVQVAVPDGAVRVAVDGELLQRMIQPLADNAALYGGSVELELTRLGAVAAVTVTDGGPGVDEDEHARIFEPGARGSAAAAHDGGAGLGLPLARRLARSAGGDVVAVASTAGGRFVLTLPLAA
jgi:signal transduction histidine kinase